MGKIRLIYEVPYKLQVWLVLAHFVNGLLSRERSTLPFCYFIFHCSILVLLVPVMMQSICKVDKIIKTLTSYKYHLNMALKLIVAHPGQCVSVSQWLSVEL